jgi:hypothetical protein
VLGAMGFTADLVFERAVRWLFPWYGAEKASQRKVAGPEGGAALPVRVDASQRHGGIGETV